jgi:hypothetical protein
MSRRIRVTNAATGAVLMDGPAAELSKRARAAASATAARAAASTTAARVQTRLDSEDLIDRAIAGGVINADSATRATYVAAYAADPAGTRAFLASLGMRDTGVTQAATDTDDYPAEFLSATERKSVNAAREGRSPRIIR